jgi:predicted component of type VI protein secretion system
MNDNDLDHASSIVNYLLSSAEHAVARARDDVATNARLLAEVRARLAAHETRLRAVQALAAAVREARSRS